jgi:hypothetical protein
MINKLLFSIIVLSLMAPAHPKTTQVYVWRNESGELVFSDSPKAGAEEITTSDANVIKSITRVDAKVLDINPQQISKISYNINVSSPKNQTTIRDNTGSVFISANITPTFKQGLKVQLILDGVPEAQAQALTVFSLKNIDRGEHTIKMLLINETGKVIASSKLVTFYMHRAAIN